MKTNLHNCEPMKILDIGAGCGQFAFLAKFFGHDAHATNPPRIKLRPKGEDRHLYHALCNLYQIESHELMIHAKQAITGIAERFDMITALMTEFNHIAGTPWGVEEWDFFLDDIKGCLLKPGGIIFLGLTRGKLSEESWSYLKSRATWYDEKGKHIFIKTRWTLYRCLGVNCLDFFCYYDIITIFKSFQYIKTIIFQKWN
jgi:SAM-dependent methyltransferase